MLLKTVGAVDVVLLLLLVVYLVLGLVCVLIASDGNPVVVAVVGEWLRGKKTVI